MRAHLSFVLTSFLAVCLVMNVQNAGQLALHLSQLSTNNNVVNVQSYQVGHQTHHRGSGRRVIVNI
jgi:hypothetical protein